MENNKRPENMARIDNAALAEKFIEDQVSEVKKQVGSKKSIARAFGRSGFFRRCGAPHQGDR